MFPWVIFSQISLIARGKKAPPSAEQSFGFGSGFFRRCALLCPICFFREKLCPKSILSFPAVGSRQAGLSAVPHLSDFRDARPGDSRLHRPIIPRRKRRDPATIHGNCFCTFFPGSSKAKTGPSNLLCSWYCCLAGFNQFKLHFCLFFFFFLRKALIFCRNSTNL